jgi:hypothetical protein
MPNLTFFVLAAIAGCSCLSACLVRKNNVLESDELPDEAMLYRNISRLSTRENDNFIDIQSTRREGSN